MQHDRRNNAVLAAVVEQGIRLDSECGAALAWAYMTQQGLPAPTILRVLASGTPGGEPRRTVASSGTGISSGTGT